MSLRFRHLAMSAAVAAWVAGCAQPDSRQSVPTPGPVPVGQRPMATSEPVTATTPTAVPPAVTTPVPTPVTPPAASTPEPAATATPVPTSPAVSTKLSFDVFGRHKEYDRVVATTRENDQGRTITTIEAYDGANSLKLEVEGSGVGEHQMLRAEIKDELLGDQPYVLDASQPNIAGTVTFTEFDPASGKVAGSFEAGYKGFPPVMVQNGTLVASIQEPAGDDLKVAGE